MFSHSCKGVHINCPFALSFIMHVLYVFKAKCLLLHGLCSHKSYILLVHFQRYTECLNLKSEGIRLFCTYNICRTSFTSPTFARILHYSVYSFVYSCAYMGIYFSRKGMYSFPLHCHVLLFITKSKVPFTTWFVHSHCLDTPHLLSKSILRSYIGEDRFIIFPTHLSITVSSSLSILARISY